MPRYVKQQNKTSCGPVAVLNALKWAGCPAIAKDLQYIGSECGYLPAVGTFPDGLQQGIHNLGHKFFKSKKIRRPTIATIDEHLKAGGSIILIFNVPKKNHGSHCFFIEGVYKGQYLAVNYQWKRKTKSLLSRKTLKKLISIRKKEYPAAWYLKKL